MRAAVARRLACLLVCALAGHGAQPQTGPTESVRAADYERLPSDLPKPAGAGVPAERATDATLRAADAFRLEHGLGPLEREARLTAAARRFATFLAAHHRLGHTADGRTPGERAAAAGYRYCAVGENLGYQYDSRGYTAEELARALLEGWKQSAPHRENLLNPHATQTGLGIARSEATGAYFAVHLLGRPASARVRFEVVNATGRTVPYRVSATGPSEQSRTWSLAPRVTRVHERCGPAALELPGLEAGGSVEVTDGTVIRLTAGEDGAVAVRAQMPVER